ncbi:bifunctional metallophosphatase/5'-nucleotidase [Bacillus sp. PAMC26568]|nr:bifunctional metallophosphatase/5'-nucleotidase [Bacillus sp. PAMC26568]
MNHTVKIASIFFLILFVLFLSSVYAGSSGQAGTGENQLAEIHLLGMNDFHGQLTTHSTLSGKKVGGAEYLAAHINRLRQEHENTMLVHAGDMVGGSPPISSLFQDEPTVHFLNQLQVDVGTPGNHEFDQGVDELSRLVHGGSHFKTGFFKGTHFNYISANVINKETGEPLFSPYTIKEIDGMKIGFIGVVTTETNQFLLPENRNQIEIIDEITAINQSVKQLQEQGIKSIVVLAHVSAKSGSNGKNPSEDLIDMAPKIDDEVDLIFGGHSHQLANTVVDNKLIVQSYSYGKALSDVQLTVDRRTSDIVQKEAAIVLTDHLTVKPDADALTLIKKYTDKLGDEYRKSIGTTQQNFSRKKDAKGDSPLAELIAEAMRSELDTEIAFVHHGGIRESLEKGDITKQQLYAALPFKHHGVKMSLTGKEMKSVLEQQWALKKENLLQVKGVTFSIDRNAPKGERISNLRTEEGKQIQENESYTIAASNYLASGGDGFSEFKKAELIKKGPDMTELLAAYIQTDN